MADSMCGPSNGAKNLVAHVDRDRSHHQDRLVGAPQSGPGNAFRSQTPFSNGAEAAFGNFQQAGAPMEPAFAPGLDLNAMGPAGHFAPAGGAYGPAVPGGPAAVNNIGPGAPAARLASLAGAGTSHQEWVAQFSGMQIGPDAAGPSAAMRTQAQARAAPMAPVNQGVNVPRGPFGMPMFGAAAPGAFGFAAPGMNAMAHAQPQAALAQDEAAAIDAEAFNRAFGEYEDAEFKRELADWTEQQKVANSEFAAEQDKWMAEHGPRAAPTAAEMEVIDADLEALAQEQEKRRADDELARAATDIVNSVADNTSAKFKNSRFFELMRRIGNHEVVVEGDGFVDANTGEKVTTSHVDDDGNDTSVKNDVNGSAATTPAATNGSAPPQGADGQRA